MRTPQEIKEKIQTIIQLPALPTVAMEVVDLVDNPKTSASRLGKVIAIDQALTAKVLKIANSPFYGFPKKISTIDFAIIVLGFDALKEIIISISLISSLQKKSDPHLDAQMFWDHAISTGVVARRLARDLGYRVSGEVFVGGLLHDMGISILHRFFTSEFKQIVEASKEPGVTFLNVEERILGVTHAEIGGWLAERWNLPDHLMEALKTHHSPGRATQNPDLVALVHCADVLANRISEQPVEFDKGIDYDPEALARLNLDDTAKLEEITAKYKEIVSQDVEFVTALMHSHPL